MGLAQPYLIVCCVFMGQLICGNGYTFRPRGQYDVFPQRLPSHLRVRQMPEPPMALALSSPDENPGELARRSMEDPVTSIGAGFDWSTCGSPERCKQRYSNYVAFLMRMYRN
ncbi:unnamed protein product, partial [Cyprideis torosa]